MPAQTQPAVPEPPVPAPPVPRPAQAPTFQRPPIVVPPSAPTSRPLRATQDQSTNAPKPVTILVRQSYDHYNQRYRRVRRVETLVYDGGYPQEEVHCNRASYRSFTVALDELKIGDRFQVRVTWDDGSDLTMEEKVTEWTANNFVIDEPLYFDAAYDS